MRRAPAHIHRVRAGRRSRGVTTPVSFVYLPVSLTGPGPSGSPEPTRLCRGCSHPHQRLPARAASSFTPPLRQQGDGGLTPHPEHQRLVAHVQAAYDRHRDLLKLRDHRCPTQNAYCKRSFSASPSLRMCWPFRARSGIQHGCLGWLSRGHSTDAIRLSSVSEYAALLHPLIVARS
jgi:hypothetical protein